MNIPWKMTGDNFFSSPKNFHNDITPTRDQTIEIRYRLRSIECHSCMEINEAWPTLSIRNIPMMSGKLPMDIFNIFNRPSMEHFWWKQLLGMLLLLVARQNPLLWAGTIRRCSVQILTCFVGFLFGDLWTTLIPPTMHSSIHLFIRQ